MENPVSQGAVAPNTDRFEEATEKMGTMLRWEEAIGKGQENTIYLGAIVQGIYKAMKTNIGQNDSNIYELELADGQLVSFWGSQLMDGKFNQIEVGMEVRVSYLGVAQPKTANGRAYRNFKVEYAKPVTTMNEVATTPATTPVADAVENANPVTPAPAAPAPVAATPPTTPTAPVTPAPAPAPAPGNQGF